MKIRVKYHDEKMPRFEQIEKGNWIDMRIIGGKINGKPIEFIKDEIHHIEYFKYKQGDFMMLNLGVSIEIPKGWEVNIVPRSSTFKNYGVIQTNHFGVGDDTFVGDNDVYHFPCYALKDGMITKYDRVCQFRLNEKMEVLEIEEVDFLGNEERGGFGTTGTR